MKREIIHLESLSGYCAGVSVRRVLLTDSGPMEIASMDSDLTVFTQALIRPPAAAIRCAYCGVKSAAFDICPRCGAPKT